MQIQFEPAILLVGFNDLSKDIFTAILSQKIIRNDSNAGFQETSKEVMVGR